MLFVLVLVCALAVLLGWLVGAGRLGGDRAKLLSERERFVNVMESVRTQRDGLLDLQEREDAVIERTLGGDLESVDSRIRARLYALGSSAGLADLSVATTGSSAKESPAKRLFKRSGSQRELREEADFVEVAASLSGEGTYEQVLRLLGWIIADGWIKRVDQVRFDPSPDGSRIRISVRLVTIFLPNREPAELPGPGELDPGQLAPIIASNMFSLPPPSVQVPPHPPAVATAPTQPGIPSAARRFPYDQWMVTGVVEGPDGPEAWLRNAATNERRTLQRGGAIGKAVLLEARGEDATFELNEETFDVRIGRSIAAGRDTSR
jgi:hypothetical protein